MNVKWQIILNKARHKIYIQFSNFFIRQFNDILAEECKLYFICGKTFFVCEDCLERHGNNEINSKLINRRAKVQDFRPRILFVSVT